VAARVVRPERDEPEWMRWLGSEDEQQRRQRPQPAELMLDVAVTDGDIVRL
jgi:hypothetical protein